MTEGDRSRLIDETRKGLKKTVIRGKEFVYLHDGAFDDDKLSIINTLNDALSRLAKAKTEDELWEAWNVWDSSIWDLKFVDESISNEYFDAVDTKALYRLKENLANLLYDNDLYKRKNSDSYIFDNQIALELDASLHKGVYSLYAKTGRSFDFDAGGRNWNNIKIPGPYTKDNTELKRDTNGWHLTSKETGETIYEHEGWVDGFTGKSYFNRSDEILQGIALIGANERFGIRTGPMTTREVADYAFGKGYDSVVIRNLRDIGGETEYRGTADIYIFNAANAVKSADPVTYDEDGNVIPITERFNESNEDIRHSLRSVAPVQPSSNAWSRTLTTDEARRLLPNLWDVTAEESEARNPTQITSTVKSYRNVYNLLKQEGFDGTILDASSGLGYGTRAGIEEYGFDVEDIEPYPDKTYKPQYTDYSKLNKKYDVIISNAVLNVLPQDQRDALVVKMGQLLNEGGRIFVNVRGDDVNSLAGKDNINVSPREWLVRSTRSYQKGFKRAELVAYLQDALGDGFTVKPFTKFGSGTWAIVTKETDRTDAIVKYQAREKYSYDELISKDDMPLTKITISQTVNRSNVIATAKKEAAKVGKTNPDGSVSVYVKDAKADVIVSPEGLRHGLTYRGSLSEKAAVIEKIGEILKNSVKVNELVPKNENARATYVLIGCAVDGDGNQYVVRSIVNSFTYNLESVDVLYAANTKKEPAVRNAPGVFNPPTGSYISIAQLLDFVNRFYPEILSADVLKHFGHDFRPEGNPKGIEKDVLYQERAKSNREILSEALESATQNEIEAKRLAEYKSKVEQADELQAHLSELRDRIFGKADKKGQTVREIQDEIRKTNNRIDIIDKQLLRLEAMAPIRRILNREKAENAKLLKEQVKLAESRTIAEYEERSRELVAKYGDRLKERYSLAEQKAKIKKDIKELDKLFKADRGIWQKSY